MNRRKFLKGLLIASAALPVAKLSMASVIDTLPEEYASYVNEHFHGWQPQFVIIKRKDGKPINNWEAYPLEPNHE
jgi:hypothetical protein